MVGVVALGLGSSRIQPCCSCFSSPTANFLCHVARWAAPAVFSRVHKRFKTPHVGTIITGVFVGGAALFSSLEDAVDFTNIGNSVRFLPGGDRHHHPAVSGIRIAKGRSACPAAHGWCRSSARISCIVLASQLPHRSWWRFAILVRHRLVLYFSYGYRTAGCGRMAAARRRLNFNPKQAAAQKDVDKCSSHLRGHSRSSVLNRPRFSGIQKKRCDLHQPRSGEHIANQAEGRRVHAGRVADDFSSSRVSTSRNAAPRTRRTRCGSRA